MKKLITIILAMAMLLPVVALADLPDITSLSDQELKDLIEVCSAELASRDTAKAEETLLFDQDGVKLFQTGEAYVYDEYMYIPVAIHSEKDFELSLGMENVKLNGWDVYSSGVFVSANAKKKGELSFKIADADVSEISQIESLEFSWVIFNNETWEFPYRGEVEEHRFW